MVLYSPHKCRIIVADKIGSKYDHAGIVVQQSKQNRTSLINADIMATAFTFSEKSGKIEI